MGAAAAVWHDGRLIEAVAGAVEAAGAPVQPRTAFRMGSIAKVCTSTVLRQLLDEHGRSLDERVEALLPGCVPPASRSLTWRHVLTHRTGIDGTYWQGFGDDAEAMDEYARRVTDLGTVFAPDESWGYSNSAYVLAGAAVQLLGGGAYDAVVGERLIDSLRLTDGCSRWPTRRGSCHRVAGPWRRTRRSGGLGWRTGSMRTSRSRSPPGWRPARRAPWNPT